VSEDDPKKQGIAITDGWFEELTKHPYHSSKQHDVDHVEKPGTGIFLMKESSKLYRPQKEREKIELKKRLGGPSLAALMQGTWAGPSKSDRTWVVVSSVKCRHRSKATRR